MARELHLSRWDAAHVHGDWDRAHNIITRSFGPLLESTNKSSRFFRDTSLTTHGNMPRYGHYPETPGSSDTTGAGGTSTTSIAAVSDTEPDPTQSSTSLDFSMTTPASTVLCSSSNLGHSVDGGASDRDKRKGIGSGTSTVDRPRKRSRYQAIKATHLVDPEVLADLADFRYFVLHGVELAQDMLVRQKADVRGATQYFLDEHQWLVETRAHSLRNSTARRPRHSLFHDIETAKLNIIESLLRAYNYADLAQRLSSFLSLEFRNTYALGIILDAGIIDGYSPHASPALWESDPDQSRNLRETCCR
ncbi:hypothetical protein DFH07DRAFT_764843 [Mycena maculata]|uniref:Uncharacterized protein n=1 Tax=Mycena maculata TaxID=230809 RepID=A0AAD7HXN0_9AGAR|nr:hypothetical protein DFH07DRAFT_781615 [Mycena maculata]KAJ7761609.1 hypothetical protein DFH07DRAFT_771466 [Mycena maculata]KAJ7781827.1 hypothetical protein DFH07DRAFT_764843 [Mycena maculata]